MKFLKKKKKKLDLLISKQYYINTFPKYFADTKVMLNVKVKKNIYIYIILQTTQVQIHIRKYWTLFCFIVSLKLVEVGLHF